MKTQIPPWIVGLTLIVSLSVSIFSLRPKCIIGSRFSSFSACQSGGNRFPPTKLAKTSNADVPPEWASKLGECWIMPCKRQPSYTSAIPKGWVLILIQSDFIILLLNKLLDFILQVSWAQPAYNCIPGLCTGRRSKQLILEESMNTMHHGASRCMLSSAGWPGITWRPWKPEGHSSGWERDSTLHSAWTSFDISCVWFCVDIQDTMHPTP